MPRLHVFDFDGTATLSEAEAVPFVAAYRDDLAALCRLSGPEADGRIDAVLADIAARPERWAFRFDGLPVAPASVDPYLRMGAVAETLFDDLGIFRDAGDRGRLTGGVLYRRNYALTLAHPVFRPDAREVFGRLAGSPTFVVTNSDTVHVAEKIGRLGGVDWLGARVRGNARKFVVDPGFDRVPPTLDIPGLPRPVYVRRAAYFDRLDALRADAGVAWADVRVIGDIFELDLALPLVLGADVVLVANEHTPPWELEFVRRHARVATTLADAAFG